MATFSPSPTPRRSTRLRPPANSPPRRIRVGNSSTSRFATPVRGTGYLSVDDNAISGMDVDEGNSLASDRSTMRPAGDTIFAKSDELSVSFYTDLPVEVKQVLKNAGEPSNKSRTIEPHKQNLPEQKRFLWRRVYGGYRHFDWICSCRIRADVFCVATCSGMLLNF
jgi:hypothetical protein